MRIAVNGAAYASLVDAAGLADAGHHDHCRDDARNAVCLLPQDIRAHDLVSAVFGNSPRLMSAGPRLAAE